MTLCKKYLRSLIRTTASSNMLLKNHRELLLLVLGLIPHTHVVS